MALRWCGTWGDGNLFSRPVDTASGPGDGFVYTARISYLYPAVGNFLVSTISFCSCFGLISAASVAVAVSEPPCSENALDNFAVAYLTALSAEPYEQGTTFYCSNNNLKTRTTVVSGVDKCSLENFTVYSNDIGWAHTHPLFRRSNEPVQCGFDKNGKPRMLDLQNISVVNDENSAGEHFSEADKSISSTEFPGYLKTPVTNQVKKCPGDC